MQKPLVSVLMLTYNHEPYIVQALESALMQKTNFKYEIVIGDDCSTDNTRNILKKYKKKYPTIITLLFHKKNLKPVGNFMEVYKKCTGKYIAILEGDDYWTSKNKLQKQVDFLDKNVTYSGCYHYTQMINKNDEPLFLLPIEAYREPIISLKHLMERDSFMGTCSIMFRNKLFGNFPSWFKKITYIADFPFIVLHAQYGKIKLLKPVMSVYRFASSNHAFSAQSDMLVHKEKLFIFNSLNKYFHYTYDYAIRPRVACYYFIISKSYLKLNDKKEAIKYYQKYKQIKKTKHFISLIERTIYPFLLYLIPHKKMPSFLIDAFLTIGARKGF